ncbi:MAG: SRPBCC family protein [Bacteroidota bacterium]
MEISQTIIVNRSVPECWEVLGEQFTEISNWASAVNHAEGDGKDGLNGANCDIRGCDVSGIGEIQEKLIAFDPEKHFLAYQVIAGLPKMLKSGQNNWRLTAIDTNHTRVNMKALVEPKGFIGNLMKPLIRMNFKKMSGHLLEEFKYFLEKGRPHPRKVKAGMNSSKKKSKRALVGLSVVLIVLLATGLSLQSCKIADLRTLQVNASTPNREVRAIRLLDEVIANGNLDKLANAETYSFDATDDWKGIMTLINPLPKDNAPMEFRYRPNSFDGQFYYTGTNKKTVHGVQSFNYYNLMEDKDIKVKKKKKMTFTIPAIQYFFEMPLRLKNAPILKYAGTKEFEGDIYDLVFATWVTTEPHKEHDQYLLYISQDDRRLKFANYTIRANYVPAPKNMYGSIRYEALKINSDGITYPGKMYIQVNGLKKKKKAAHVLTVDNLRLNEFDVTELYPLKGIAFIGDSKE